MMKRIAVDRIDASRHRGLAGAGGLAGVATAAAEEVRRAASMPR